MTHATPSRLMESEGIGWTLVAPHGENRAPRLDGSKNDVAIEGLAATRDQLEKGAQGIIAILIGL